MVSDESTKPEKRAGTDRRATPHQTRHQRKVSDSSVMSDIGCRIDHTVRSDPRAYVDHGSGENHRALSEHRVGRDHGMVVHHRCPPAGQMP